MNLVDFETSPVAPSDAGSKVVRAIVVDDAREFRDLVANRLVEEGFVVESVGDGHRAIELARTFLPDVIVLDLGLPDLDGVEVCRQIRTFSNAYIVMLTGRDDEVDKLVGLSVGADDYMTKPFSIRELVARVRTMLRRPRESISATHEHRLGDLIIDSEAREVRMGDETLNLTRIEFDILNALSEHPRQVITRGLLLEMIWGSNWVGDDHMIDVHVSTLRHKLGDDARSPRYVKTVRGVGYRLGDGN
jgi:DNA-binding response OmpR family regulator